MAWSPVGLFLGAATGCDDAAVSRDPGTGGSVGTGGQVQGGSGGGSGGAGGPGGVSGTGGVGGSGPPGACSDGSGAALGVALHATAGAAHVAACSPVSYATVPPSSGSHYPTWPAYKTYVDPVPWGYLVHGLEHGAVEVVYNCPAGCASEVAAAQAWIDALPAETACGGARPRVILAPDPTLDVRWAATAWLWTLRACSFDEAMFQQFFTEHYNQGLEFVCSSGDDLSSTGWCL